MAAVVRICGAAMIVSSYVAVLASAPLSAAWHVASAVAGATSMPL